MKARYKIKLPYAAGCSIFLMLHVALQSLQAQVGVEMTSGIKTEVTGMIRFECNGNWQNDGDPLPGNSTLLLQGAHIQLLRQEAGAFHHLTISKDMGEVILSGNIHVNGGLLSIISQDLDLNGHIITLDAQAMLNETSGNTVKGATGYVTTTRILSAPSNTNVAGMGLVLSGSQDPGVTEIRRGHGVQTANGAESIHRYFDVMPQFNSGLDATLRFMYDESELNGQDETALKMYRSPDEGLNWEEIPGVLDVEDNYFEADGVNTFSRFTLSSYCMETCMVTQANVQSTILSLNSAGLAYLTPEAINNGSRGACGLDTMFVSPDVFDCDDIGMQPVTFTVRDHNGFEKSAVVNIEIRDNIAPDVHCKNITLHLDESCLETITPDDIDDGSYDACGVSMSINVNSFDCSHGGPNNVILTATDPSGNSAGCTAIVTVLLPVTVICHETTLNIGTMGSIDINPYDILESLPGNYEGFSFVVAPATLFCDQLGANSVTITGTDPFGEVTVCQTTVFLEGPDADCDGVSDACDICDGGDDQQDTDSDGIPDCADWDGWENLLPAWQCANNKVFICHEGNVICINENAVTSHLDHGDMLGPCEAVSCPASMAQPIFAESVIENTRDDEHSDVDGKDQSLQVHTGTLILENHPNPFYPETRIRIYIPGPGEAVLSVFDIMGKPIRIITKDDYEKGWHEFWFDGGEYPPGIYYCRLENNGHTITRSMVMLNK